ncbi:hypothetical protein [Clostridium kluyveri]|uniref:DUF8042 domain-containing protein n=2 Tax=Clostridium kluyveri TaxID=1534 RepID=A5MZ10_CLOK5|nr:hypothetical protein [Clostridium kluyveri]EDK34106.1 Conserved hypothetical protein [Clostridium kluyveri DSM 555]BAH06884.1 hypothetical protein CKR_1833 [Clostridium kluyveri NBRC 12016]
MSEKTELLKTASDYIVNLKSGIAKAAEYFQSGDEQKGFNLVTAIAEGFNWLTQALAVSKDVLKQKISVDDLNEKLEEIVEAMENQDTILIGDLLQYELIPIVENIEESVNQSMLN